MDRFFNFKLLVSPLLVKWIYIVGAFLATGGGIFLALGEFSNAGGRHWFMLWQHRVFFGVGLLTVGNLAWRLACEYFIVIFSIYEKLESD